MCNDILQSEDLSIIYFTSKWLHCLRVLAAHDAHGVSEAKRVALYIYTTAKQSCLTFL